MANRNFTDVIEKMPKYLQVLQGSPLLARHRLTELPGNQGIYVFYHDGKPMYVGRSDNLKERIQQHGRPSSGSNSASFAFNMAKWKLRRISPVKVSMKRQDLEKSKEFKPIFDEAKEVVRNMDVRVVIIDDAIEQTIFEVYAHLELKTPFNSFENH